MTHQWPAYVVVGLLSAGAGLAIAGPPNNVPVEATITPPTTATVPEPPLVTSSSSPDTEPVVPSSSEAVETTEATATTDAPGTTEVEVQLIERSGVSVVAANGADVAGAASRMVDWLVGEGYVDVVSRDGTQAVDLTVVYYAEGFENEAVRLAGELDLAPESAQPIGQAPNVLVLPDNVDLLIYVGADRAN